MLWSGRLWDFGCPFGTQRNTSDEAERIQFALVKEPKLIDTKQKLLHPQVTTRGLPFACGLALARLPKLQLTPGSA